MGRDEESAVRSPSVPDRLSTWDRIAVRKTHLYRVKALLSGASCAAGDMMSVSLVARSGLFANAGSIVSVPCGKEAFLIAGLRPGAWWIEARTAKRPIQTVERASLSFEVTDKNIEVKGVLSRGADIVLRFVARNSR